MTDAAELDATLDDIEERVNRTTQQVGELAEQVNALEADLGPMPDVRVAPPSDLEAMLADAPDERDVGRLKRRLAVVETHLGHRGPDPCPCRRCARLRRTKSGEGPDAQPFGSGRVTLADAEDDL